MERWSLHWNRTVICELINNFLESHWTLTEFNICKLDVALAVNDRPSSSTTLTVLMRTIWTRNGSVVRGLRVYKHSSRNLSPYEHFGTFCQICRWRIIKFKHCTRTKQFLVMSCVTCEVYLIGSLSQMETSKCVTDGWRNWMKLIYKRLKEVVWQSNEPLKITRGISTIPLRRWDVLKTIFIMIISSIQNPIQILAAAQFQS